MGQNNDFNRFPCMYKIYSGYTHSTVRLLKTGKLIKTYNQFHSSICLCMPVLNKQKK